MNNVNMIEVFDAVTGGIDGSASVDDWENMTAKELQDTADAMADEHYDPLSSKELALVSVALMVAQDSEFHESRDSLKED